MRALRSLTILAVATTVMAGAAPAPAKTHPGFDRLKSLVGEWEGKAGSGSPIRVSYRLVSSGTALMETLDPGGEMEMVTLYHPDGDRLMMTHYCGAGNQPRMKAEVPGGEIKKLSFAYVDATNLKGPKEGHMIGLTLAFEDPDHFSQTWSWTGEPPSKPDVFRFQRKK